MLVILPVFLQNKVRLKNIRNTVFITLAFAMFLGPSIHKYLNHSLVLSYSCKRKSLIDSPRPYDMSHKNKVAALLVDAPKA